MISLARLRRLLSVGARCVFLLPIENLSPLVPLLPMTVNQNVLVLLADRIEQEESNLKCRFTPLSVGSHTYIGKSCVVESAGIGCNVRIEDGCVLVRVESRRCPFSFWRWGCNPTVAVQRLKHAACCNASFVGSTATARLLTRVRTGMKLAGFCGTHAGRKGLVVMWCWSCA